VIDGYADELAAGNFPAEIDAVTSTPPDPHVRVRRVEMSHREAVILRTLRCWQDNFVICGEWLDTCFLSNICEQAQICYRYTGTEKHAADGLITFVALLGAYEEVVLAARASSGSVL